MRESTGTADQRQRQTGERHVKSFPFDSTYFENKQRIKYYFNETLRTNGALKPGTRWKGNHQNGIARLELSWSWVRWQLLHSLMLCSRRNIPANYCPVSKDRNLWRQYSLTVDMYLRTPRNSRLPSTGSERFPLFWGRRGFTNATHGICIGANSGTDPFYQPTSEAIEIKNWMSLSNSFKLECWSDSWVPGLIVVVVSIWSLGCRPCLSRIWCRVSAKTPTAPPRRDKNTIKSQKTIRNYQFHQNCRIVRRWG